MFLTRYTARIYAAVLGDTLLWLDASQLDLDGIAQGLAVPRGTQHPAHTICSELAWVLSSFACGQGGSTLGSVSSGSTELACLNIHYF